MEEMSIEDGGTKKGFPLHVGFILGNEFCERYSYYGMRTVLVIYLTSSLIGWDDDLATAVYHAFTVLAYLFPLLGAMIADSWWGKYWTILVLSIVYAIGSGINMMSAIKPIGGDNLAVHAALSSLGLFVIAFGTGGIKPCVSAFGGDQFDADQDQYRRSFFSLFYLSINAGSLVSTFVSPLIREQVQCFGDDCYALAFGIPTALMFVAIILFVIGTPYYTRQKPQGNVFAEVCSTIYNALKKRSKVPSKHRDKEHWLDYADNGSNAQLIQDIKYVLKILVLYIPLPVFWSLFDQQGSRWTLQAVRMNGIMGGGGVILPDQFQLCNPLIIVTLIPIFEATLYPCLRKYNINFSPLRRMGFGMVLAGVAFVVAALVQMEIDVNLTAVPKGDQSSLRVINGVNCDVEITGNLNGWDNGAEIVPFGKASKIDDKFTSPGEHTVSFECGGFTSLSTTVTLAHEKAFDLVLYSEGTVIKTLGVKKREVKKSNSGKAFISVANMKSSEVKVQIGDEVTKVAVGEKMEFSKEFSQGAYDVMVDDAKVGSINPLTGAAYTVPLLEGVTDVNDETVFKDIYENDVNIFWMVPQYFIITLGEVFLSVTGLEFSYSQAPLSMKSVLQSLWLLTVSIGNIIVLIVAESSLVPNQADEYFLFAGLIGGASLLFLFLAMRYEYIDESVFAVPVEGKGGDNSDSDNSDSDDDGDKKSIASTTAKSRYARDNEAFEKNTKL